MGIVLSEGNTEMKQVIVTFHLQDGTHHQVILHDANVKQAYDFGQQKAREFNSLRMAEMKSDRVKEVSIRFPIEYSGNVILRSH